MLGTVGLLGRCDLHSAPEAYEYYYIDPDKRADSTLNHLLRDLPRSMPALWNKRNGQRAVQQVWFPGVHSNVGGGYADCGISDVALNWMLDRAMECGLKMDNCCLHRHNVG